MIIYCAQKEGGICSIHLSFKKLTALGSVSPGPQGSWVWELNGQVTVQAELFGTDSQSGLDPVLQRLKCTNARNTGQEYRTQESG